jgi:hypothetical protein
LAGEQAVAYSVVVGRDPVEGRRSQHERRRIGWTVAALLILVGGLATVITARHLDHQYGPVQQGSFEGLYSDHNFVFSKDGFSYGLAAAPGVAGELIASLDNLGAHSVKITSIDLDDVVTRIQWSTYRIGPNRNGLGINTPWQAFPAIVPAHDTIRLLITIHHPDSCPHTAKGSSGHYYAGLLTVHWDSLLHSHTTTIDDPLATRNIRVC